MRTRHVFVTGATGYLGRRLVPALVERGHRVRALIRPGSEERAPGECERVLADPLAEGSFVQQIPPCDTFVQLVGVPHPSPRKAALFRSVDLVSARASVAAASQAGVGHFVYVSVAQPAPVMKAYQTVRAEVEQLIRSREWRATVLRPWYVLGPGHWWPSILLPVYWICERLPATRAGARRLGLVTLAQMVAALVHAVEDPPNLFRVLEVPEIRRLGRTEPVGKSTGSP